MSESPRATFLRHLTMFDVSLITMGPSSDRVSFETRASSLHGRSSSSTSLGCGKLSGVALLVGAGVFAHPTAAADRSFVPFGTATSALAAFGVAMIPVFFAYNGFLSATLP